MTATISSTQRSGENWKHILRSWDKILDTTPCLTRCQDGNGGWKLVQDSGLPSKGLSIVHSITLADVDHDGFPEIIALQGGQGGSITIWKQR